METRRYRLTFLTPAFLGDANQNGRWRTPPIKHLLREWWRVAWAQDHGFPTEPRHVKEMRAAEGNLFGNAWLDDREGGHRKSRVRIRLDTWNVGRMGNWPSREEQKAFHPEVGNRDNGMSIGAELYLGYGPLANDRGTKSTILKANAAIQPGEEALLRIAAPEEEIDRIDRTMRWADRFGALGGRSRNGWGAFRLQPLDGDHAPALLPAHPWEDAMRSEWAQGIGVDEDGPLIWQTGPRSDWHELMKGLAETKISFRTHFRFTSGKGAQRAEPRHWLSYPVTNHDVRDWRNLRLPNSLRFTARKDEGDQLRGVIYHMPTRPIRDFRPDDRVLLQLWADVHQHLDRDDRLTRIQE